MSGRLLIIGNSGGTNVGGSFFRGAQKAGIDTQLVEAGLAMKAPKWIRHFNWRVRGKRPTRLNSFSRQIVKIAKETCSSWVLVVGIAPPDSWALEELGKIGVKRINYLTDDPFNPAHKAKWFLNALPKYDLVFSPRNSNLDDLRRAGCRAVYYLPFAYDEEIFFPDSSDAGGNEAFSSEVIFAGGADRDRLPYLIALSDAGFDVALYGDYWDRYAETRRIFRGYADPQTLRKAISGAKVALCLVRRANRDGHSMRTFEVPALGACMLVEDTEEQREIFGADGQAVVYFKDIAEMVDKLSWLLAHDAERKRLAQTSHQMIIQAKHTYRDRLVSMLKIAGE